MRVKLEDKNMDKKFKPGDRVYHRNLKQYGIFIGYAWESEEECDVDFETEDGEMEQKHVSVNWLEPIQKTYSIDNIIEYLDKTVFYKYYPCNVIDDIKESLENLKS